MPNGLSINTSGLISGNLNYFSAGIYHPTITVREPGGLTATVTFQWTVNNVNREPVFTQPASQTSNEGSSPGLQLIANDPDGETLIWEYINLPTDLNMNSTGYISGILNYVSANVYNPSVMVTDPHGAYKIVSFQWTVLNVNPYPTLTQPPDTISNEGSSPSLQIQAADPEGGTLTYSAVGLPSGLDINSGGLISGSLSYHTGGIYHPTVRVTEPGGLSVEDTFTWTVSEVNPSPIMDQPIAQNASEGSSPSLQITGSDPEGGTLTWSATNLPPGLSINSSGLITGYLNYKSAGTYYPTIQVSEPEGLIRTISFTWIIANVNLPPTLTRPANQTSGEGTAISLQVSASEPDDETLTWTSSGLPVGLSINASGLISGNLNYTTAGEYDPTITVTRPRRPV